MLVPQGVVTEAGARPLLKPQEVWGEAAAQFDSVKGALVIKQGLFDCLPPTVSFSEMKTSSSCLFVSHNTYLNTIRVALSASTRERQVPRTGMMRIIMKMMLLKLRRVGNTVREMRLS